MNSRIRRFGIVLIVLYLAVFAQLNWLQVIKAKSYTKNPYNNRETVRDFSQPRGKILTADNVVVAESIPTTDKLKFQRSYPFGPLYAHTAGYFSLTYGTDGVEGAFNDLLAGRTDAQQFANPLNVFNSTDRTADVTMTIRSDVQLAAQQALGDREGTVVAVDPRTGAVLAMYSNISYDPTLLASHDLPAVRKARTFLNLLPAKPLLAKAFRERYFPGSTFKVITAAAGLTGGKVTVLAPIYPQAESYTPPLTTTPLKNFSGQTCGGALFDILAQSCNSAFAQMGVEIGPEQMAATASAFGFNEVIPFDLPGGARSVFPTADQFVQDTPKLAQSAIGQNDVQATPLQMALVAAAIANDGSMMAPYLVEKVVGRNGQILRGANVREWRRAVDANVARTLRQAMIGVVINGSATRLAIEGVEVGGKTGTAELGTNPPSAHAWTIGFAGPAGNPRVAVAVIVTAQPGAAEQTGGKVAAPIAQAVIAAVLATPDPLAKP